MSWGRKTVEDVCLKVTSGGTPNRRNPEFYGGEISWVKTKELLDAKIYATEETITVAGLETSAAKLLPRDTVLMAMYGATVGRLGLLEKEMACNQAACAMVVNPEIAEHRFLFYSLMSRRSEIIGLANGAAQQNLNAGIIRNLMIDLPSLEEQREIVNILGALDDKIESNQRQISLIGELLDSLSESFSESVDFVPLSNLAEQVKVSVNPQKLQTEKVLHLSIPAYDDNQTPEFVEASSIRSNKHAVEHRSILISRLNPRFFRVWWFTPTEEFRALTSTEFMVLNAKSGRAEDLAAVWLALRHPSFNDEMISRASGTSGSHQRVRPDDLLSIPVPDFSNLEIAEKGKALVLLEKSEQLNIENQRLAKLRDTLLPELLSGRITPEQLEADL